MTSEVPVSLLAEDVQAGGMWPSGDRGRARIVDIKYSTGLSFAEAPNYKAMDDTVNPPRPKETTVLLMLLQPLDMQTGQAVGEPRWELSSGGDAIYRRASQNGAFLVKGPKGDNVKGMQGGTNLAEMMTHLELVALGGDKAKMRELSANIQLLRGADCEFLRKVIKRDFKRPAINKPGQDPNAKQKDPAGVLIINKVISGWGAGQASAAANAPVGQVGGTVAAPQVQQQVQAQAPVAAGPSLDEQAQGIILSILGENPAGLNFAEMPQKVALKVSAIADPATKGQVMTKCLTQGWLSSQGMWKFEGGRLSFA